MARAVTRKLSALVAALLVATVAFPAAAEDTPSAGDVAQAEAQLSWFVELAGDPTIEGRDLASARAEKDAFRSAARSKGIALDEKYEYSDLFNGFSLRASGDAISRIRSLPGVKAIWPVVTESIPRETLSAGEVIDLATAIDQTGAKYVQETLRVTGRGVKVAVMDTGIDYHHPDLGGCFRSGRGDDDEDGRGGRGGRDGDDGRCRVIRGYDFVGDAFNGSNVPVPDRDPDDCNGHGTHVAGIIGANGQVKGVAPDVTFGAYRVFGCEGSTTADIMLAAMERALRDNMDVLNMSIGSSFQWPQYPTAVGADRLVTKRGMVVVASIGNSGPGGSTPNGLYSAGAPGVGSKVIGVASFDNTHIAQSAFRAKDGTLIPYGLATGTLGGPPASGTFDLVTNASIFACPTPAAPTAPSIGASPWAPGSLTGKVALIQRGGGCGFYLKAIHAQEAGAAGVVIFNNVAGPLNPTVAVLAAGQPVVTIPVVAITQADGGLLVTQAPATLTWGTDTVVTPAATGGIISGFSSYGVAADLSLKPDIGAPGGNIRSTWPLELGGYNNISGTSMASPHVAGAAALYLQAHRGQKPPTMRDILQNSAVPAPVSKAAGAPLDATHRQGAGMLDIRAAIGAEALVLPGKLALGESEPGPATRTITIENVGRDRELTLALSHAPALATGPSTFLPLSAFITDKPAAVTFSSPTVTVRRGRTATVSVTIEANAALPFRALYGGYIVLTDTESGAAYRVPYSGFKGDYQAIPVLTRADRRHVCKDLGGGSFGLSGGGAITYTLANAGETPNFCVHFDHQARSATFTVKDAGGNVVGTALTADYLARNSSATGFFAFAWDGNVTNAGATTALPNGTYTIVITVLKALGDPAVAGHTETFTLVGAVTIARP